MNKYIIAYISLFENQLKQVLVEAHTEVDAAYQYMAAYEDIVFELHERLNTLTEVIEQAHDMDSNISVYKLD